MPSGDVTFSVETERLRYKISFVNEGRVMQSTYCYYGDMPLAPESPKKSDDGEYSYTFVGWSEEIVPATSDKTYTAVYEAKEIEEKVDTDTGLGIYMSANLFMVAVLFVLAVLIVGAALLVIKRLII